MTEKWEKAMPCVLNHLQDCIARIPEACQCMKMSKDTYRDAQKRLKGEQ